MSTIYAPKAAAKINEAAQLIRKASFLLDKAGDSYVMHEIERVEGSHYIEERLARDLEALAAQLEEGPAI